jgi:hypothetical protein
MFERLDGHDHGHSIERRGIHGVREEADIVTRRNRSTATAPYQERERGASLILALVFITALGFVALISLSVANTSLRDDQANRTLRSDIYEASGALDVYINAMRATATWGRDGGACAALTTTFTVGHTITVSCTPVNGSGAVIVGGAGARSNRIVDLAATIGGRRIAAARAEFVDGGGSVPGASVRIRSWITAS